MSRSSFNSTDSRFATLPRYGFDSPARINDPAGTIGLSYWDLPSHLRAANAMEAAGQFFYYRVDGMKCSARPTFTFYQCDSTVPATEAQNIREIMRNQQYALTFDATIDANAANTALPVQPYVMNDTSRWGRTIPFTPQGTSIPRYKSVYYGVKQVQGTAAYVKGDLDYTGQTDNVNLPGFDPVARPVQGPRFRMGITMLNGGYIHDNWPATTAGDQTIKFSIPMKFTWYVTYFGKRPIVNL